MKTLSHLFLLIVLAFSGPSLLAQTDGPKIRCSTTEYYDHLFRSTPSLKARFEANQRSIAINSISPSPLRIMALDDTITVAIHVVGTAMMQSMVTNAVIQSQIDVLNEDYQGKNADSTRIPAAFKPLYGKSKLTFALAGTNPYGEPTNGIVRVTSNSTFSLATVDDAKFTTTGGSDAWDPTKYLNIWIVDFGNTGVLGSSVFPGDPRDLRYHGFVCDYRAFGRGAPYLFTKYKKGRTTTHEIGHFFNLQHTWGDDGGACTGKDFPDDPADDDTPNQANNTNGNPDPAGTGVVITDACSPAAPGVMYQNYLDYTDDSAMALFTKGQQIRMQNNLTTAPDRAPLLSSTAYRAAAVFSNDAAISKIISPLSTACPNFKPIVILRNSGSNNLTSVKIISVLNGDAPITYNWSGNLAPYTETNITLSTLTGTSGATNLTVYTTAPNGASDGRTSNDTAKTNFEIIGVTPLPTSFVEGFPSTQFPPSQWGINNPDGDETWQRHATIGKNAAGCAWFNDFNNPTNNRHDDLITPNFSYSLMDSVLLSFNVAAALYSAAGTAVDIDTLTILVTKDCGNSFTTVYKKWGDSLQTLEPHTTLDTEFFPTSSQWRKDTLNLRKALGVSEVQFQVYFRFSGNFENNIFIDDISINSKKLSVNAGEKRYMVYPTVFPQQVSLIHFEPQALSSVAVYNSVGQRVWATKYNGDAPGIITINLQGNAAGVYFIRMKYKDGRVDDIEKIVKQ